ncbi:MAG: extracellular solute-binding protein [Eubacteriales bacterium]|nr:extracellular solute-binding protein [Eubacteriales bacterium]
MKTKIRLLAGLLSGVLAVGGLAGCARTQPQATPAPGTTAGTPSADTQKKVTVEFFQQKREVVDIIDQIIAAFTAQNPNITIEQNNIPDSGTVLKTRCASGDVPDLFSSWFNADGKLLIDEGYVRDITGEAFMEKVEEPYKEFTRYKDANYMLPVSLNFVGVFYNKKIFEEKQVEIPTTLEQFYQVCDKLKADGVQPLQVTDKEQWTLGHAGTTVMENLMDTDQILEVINGDLSVKDIPGMDKYADFLEKTRKEYVQSDYLGTGYEAGLGDFANGTGAMLIQGNWIIPVLRKANPGFAFGVFPFPAEKAEDTKPHWGIDYALCLSAQPKDAAKGDAAVQFLNYFVDKGAQTWADEDGSLSCIKGVNSGLPEYAAITEKIQAGQAIAGPMDSDWPAGLYDQFVIVKQNFLTTWAREAFYKELDQTFKDFKQ